MSAFLLWIDFFQLLLITGVHTVHHHFRSRKEEVMEDIIHQSSSCNSSNESINSKGKYMYISVYCLNSSSATIHSKKNHCHLTQLNKHKLVHSVELTSVKYHTNYSQRILDPPMDWLVDTYHSPLDPPLHRSVVCWWVWGDRPADCCLCLTCRGEWRGQSSPTMPPHPPASRLGSSEVFPDLPLQ